MFNKTKELTLAIPLINGIDGSKLSRLLTRIIEKLHHSSDEFVFNADEEAKLQVALSLNDQQLKLIINTLTSLMQQIAYQVAKPKAIAAQLDELGFDEEKVLIIVQVWADNASKICQRLRDDSYNIAPKQLVDVNWHLKLRVNQQSQSHLKLPIAQFDFTLQQNNGESEFVSTDFTHDQLSKFYDQLEVIQTQLDTLQK